MKSETLAIETRQLVRRFGPREAVNGLSLQVRPGRCYGFFGRNGAGKTTTIKCLLNLLHPTSGSVRILGLDPVRDEVAVKARVAYVPDAVAFYPWMSVRETLDEFTLRTISSLLMLPRSRQATIAVKFAVLIALLFPLAVAGQSLAFRGFSPDRDPEATIIFWLPLVTAVGVAPWLTLLCRSATAGMAFSLAMPGFMFCGALAWWIATHGFTPAPQSFVFRIGAIGTVAISALGLMLGWRSFHRLEAIEGLANLPVPRWLRRDRAEGAQPVRRFHPLWLLVRKELRLQRMTIVVASGYMLGWALLAVLKPVAADEMAQVLTIFYVAMLPFMPGALASAEEHEFGTLAWQATMPMAAWQQWLVKVGVVLGLTIVLAVGVPAVLSGLPQRLPLIRLSAAVLMLAAGSLYVSSACHNTLWALLSAISVLVVVAPIASYGVPHFFVNPVELPAAGLRILAGLSVAAAVLTLAMFNHRTTDRAARPGWRHAAAAAGCAACATLALFVMI